MATFINKLMLMESQDFPLIKPKFTPNGRPLDRKKRNKRSVSLPDKLPSSVPLCMLQKPKSVTYKSLRECRESRPPLKSDLAGPNPASYTPRGLESNVSCVISPKPLNHRKEGGCIQSLIIHILVWHSPTNVSHGENSLVLPTQFSLSLFRGLMMLFPE
jgi:hypothetical protein